MYVVQWNDAFVKLVKKGRLEVPDVVACTTMAEVRRNVSEFGEKNKAEYTSLLDADLEAEQVFSLSDFRAPGKTFMEMMYDHEIHHKAQIFVCACMIGVKHVPFFR